MKLHFSRLVRFDENIRYPEDRRKFCNSYIVSYIGDDGHEYRKRFCYNSKLIRPDFPQHGTHKEINTVINEWAKTV